MEQLIGFLGYLLLEYLLIGTGRVVVFVLSFGRWRGEFTQEKEGRIFSPSGSLVFVRNGQRVVTRAGLMLAGFGFYFVLAIVAVMASIG